MTVAIGLLCSDGAVIASDSMASAGPRAGLGQKVFATPNLRIAWGVAGAFTTFPHIEKHMVDLDANAQADPALAAFFEGGPRDDAINQIAATVRNALLASYSSQVPHGLAAVAGNGHPFAANTLAVGWCGDAPYMLVVNFDASVEVWQMHQRSAAIGSGGDFATVAHSLSGHFMEDAPIPVELGLQLAWRTIDATITVSTHGVGPPVQMAVVNAEGARVLTPQEAEDVGTAVSAWRQVERDTFLNLLNGPAPETTDIDLPSIEGEAAQEAAPPGS